MTLSFLVASLSLIQTGAAALPQSVAGTTAWLAGSRNGKEIKMIGLCVPPGVTVWVTSGVAIGWVLGYAEVCTEVCVVLLKRHCARRGQCNRST